MSTYAEEDDIGLASDDAPSIGVSYYHARPLRESTGIGDPSEVAEMRALAGPSSTLTSA